MKPIPKATIPASRNTLFKKMILYLSLCSLSEKSRLNDKNFVGISLIEMALSYLEDAVVFFLPSESWILFIRRKVYRHRKKSIASKAACVLLSQSVRHPTYLPSVTILSCS